MNAAYVTRSCTVDGTAQQSDSGIVSSDATWPKDDSLQTSAETISDLKPYSDEVRNDARLLSIVGQVKQIGKTAFWGNDCLMDCTRRNGWRLNVIVAPKILGDQVFGFIVYKIDTGNKVLHVQYIAVDEPHRRRGIGSRLIKTLQQYATKVLTVSMVHRIACACVPEAVGFYHKHNFRKVKRIIAEEDEPAFAEAGGVQESQIPLQYHMEWKVPDKRKRRGVRK